MSAGFAVVIVVLMLALFYFRRRQAAQVAALVQDNSTRTPPPPVPALDLPSGYCFHPGHTWMAEQGRAMARVGIDSFAANLLGTVRDIAVVGQQRWVRQGQRLMTLTAGCETIEMLSPLEGVVAAINPEAMKDPDLALRDPYEKGWVCLIKCSEMETNRRNLIQGALAESWIQNSFQRLKHMLAEADPTLSQDGGFPVPGSFNRLSPELRKRLVNEFFLV